MNTYLWGTLLAVGLWSAAPCAEESLGRLLTSPEERAVLDAPAKGDAGIAPRRFQGVVSRRGGQAIPWVDDRPPDRREGGADVVARKNDTEGVATDRDRAAPKSGEATP